MRIKRFFLATFAGGIVMWGVAGLWHELVMAQFYTRQAHATHEGTGIILLAYLILAALMVYLYPRFSGSSRYFQEGAKFGALIGLLWVFPHGLAMAGAHGEPVAYVVKNALWHVVEQGIGGIVIAFGLKRF